MSLREVGEADFDELVLAATRPVLVDFWAEWCPPCRAMNPVLEALASDHADRIDVVKVDVDANPELAARYNALALPVMLVFDGGELARRVLGARPRHALEADLAAYLA
ncbi:MAG: thioredoxin [Protaetiibacter sp.]